MLKKWFSNQLINQCFMNNNKNTQTKPIEVVEKAINFDNVNKVRGALVGTYTTDSEGKIAVPEDLETGYYQVHENLPLGSEYAQPADQVKEVKIGATTTFNFLNSAQTFKFKLRKVILPSIPRIVMPLRIFVATSAALSVLFKPISPAPS